MIKASNLLLQLPVLCIILTVINGCSAATVDFLIDRGASDDPVAIIDAPPGDISEALPLPAGPIGRLQGSYVTFHTWLSNGNFVTKEEYYAGFEDEIIAGLEGLPLSWDDNMLTLMEFRILYGPGIELWASTPWEGLTLYSPYDLDVDELIMDPDIDPNLAALITPGMTKSEFFEVMKNYNREGGDSRQLSGDVKRNVSIGGYEPPTHNIGMQICNWVVVAGDVWWIKWINQYYSHAALVGYPGNDQTANNPYPWGYYWPNGHPDRSGDQNHDYKHDEYPDGVIDLWDATVYEAIGTNLNVAKDVGHYPYYRAFIEPRRDGIKEISFNCSPAVWDDPNWLEIFMGEWDYAWSQNNCRWGIFQNKWNFGTPAWLGKKPTYCSLLVWQAYMYSTHYNAASWEAYELDIDWDQGDFAWPGDLINSLNSYDCVEWASWKR